VLLPAECRQVIRWPNQKRCDTRWLRRKWIVSMVHHMPMAAPVAMAASTIMSALNMVFVVLLMIGWLVVAIRGPHLLKQWSYHSGVGGGMMYVGGSVVRSGGQKVGNQVGGSVAAMLKK